LVGHPVIPALLMRVHSLIPFPFRVLKIRFPMDLFNPTTGVCRV